MGFYCESKEEFIDMVESGELPLIGTSFPISSDFFDWASQIDSVSFLDDVRGFFEENPDASKEEFNWFLKDKLNELYEEAVSWCEDDYYEDGLEDEFDGYIELGLENWITNNWNGDDKGLSKFLNELDIPNGDYVNRWNLSYDIVYDEDIVINTFVDEVLDHFDDFKQEYLNENKKQSNNLKM